MNCKHCGRPSIDEVDECTDWFSCQTIQIANLKAKNKKLLELLKCVVQCEEDIDPYYRDKKAIELFKDIRNVIKENIL